jgi:hypothetical protein
MLRMIRLCPDSSDNVKNVQSLSSNIQTMLRQIRFCSDFLRHSSDIYECAERFRQLSTNTSVLRLSWLCSAFHYGNNIIYIVYPNFGFLLF